MTTEQVSSPTPETSGSAVDAGSGREQLAKGSITLVGVLFVSVATMAPGAGEAYSIVTGAPFAGGALPLAVIVALVGSLLIASSIGQLAKHLSSAAGLAGYVGRSMHSGLGFLVAWSYPAVYMFVLPYLGLVFGNLLATAIVPSASGAEFTTLWVVGALACLGTSFLVNFFGASFGTRTGVILGTFEILVLVALSIDMIVTSGSHNSAAVFTTSQATVPGFKGLSGVIAASVYGFLAFIGFEAAAPLAAETEKPRRNVPRAVVGAALLTGIFFLFCTYAATTYFGSSKMAGFLAFNGGNGWVGMAKNLWGAGWIILLIALMNSSLACSNGASMAASRSVWAMGHARALPSFFAKTHPRWKSPVNALYVLFGVGAVLTLAAGFTWGPVTSYAFFGTMVTIIVLPLYMLAALACPVYYLRYRRGEFNILLHGVIPVLGVVFLIPAFFAGTGIKVFSFVSPLTYPLNFAGPAALAWYAIGLVIMCYLLARRRSSLDKLSESDELVPESVGA